MDLSRLYAVIVDDDIYKAIDIRKALECNRITDVDIVRNQEQLWEKIYVGKEGGKKVDLIVTDMHYPLMAGADADPEAGFKLIDRIQKEKTDIPVIICSTGNYESVSGILGSVWYSELNDVQTAFKDVLGRLGNRRYHMGREENAAVFKDTEKLCKENKKLSDSIRKSIAEQKLILESENIETPKLDIFAEPAEVVISRKRTFEAASRYKGNQIAVHNFASASNPGGGVVKGSNAQEECLCRCSGLYFCLNTPEMWNGFYTPHRNAHDPIHNDDIIYTPEIIVFKTDESVPKLMEKKDWYSVNVITCAAPNLRIHPGNSYNTGDGNKKAVMNDRDLLALHEKRLRRILNVAVAEGNDTIILGAFGCGAFENKPEVVARASGNVIGEYLHAFKTIEYAIYCGPRDEKNYETFKRVLKL